SNKGWVNIGILKILFDKIANFTNKTPSILLVDCFKSHVDEETIKLASAMNIKIIVIPPGKTNKFQPLDVGIHGPLKSNAATLCKQELIKDNIAKIDMNCSLRNLDVAIKNVMTREIIKDSFRKALNFQF